MKKSLVILVLGLVCNGVFAQTNTFPPSGNVGIGIVTPQVKLDVLGQISSYNLGIGQVDGSTSARNFTNVGSNDHGSLLFSSNLYFGGTDQLKIAKTHGTMSGAAILMPGNTQPFQGGILFFTNPPASAIADANFSGITAMLIGNNGNVGIGTTDTKGYKLAVAGSMIAESVKVKLQGVWPDYVFLPSYKVPTLQETEKHIKENGHLPGIPSSDEVKANGIDLGEMNAKLLQKIEELTLYLIEIKKENQEVKERLEKLESRK